MIGSRTSVGLAAALGFAGAASVIASVDRSPPPGGVYRLKPGIYVQSNVACGDAPNAAVRRYDGRGISDAHSRACRVRVVARHRDRFSVVQSCLDAGAGPARRVAERQTVTVPDALTFTVSARGKASSYRYCPAYQLPAGLREIAS